jgi:ribosomal protein L3 glutamine methyltransferase
MSAYSDLKTIRDFLRYAVTRFNQAGLYFGHGTDNSWDEAVALILHSLHLHHDVDMSVLDARLVEEEKKKILDLINRRVEKRVPLAYLTNEAWFAGMSFYVDERVLIPRSPIAELIENHFQPWISTNKVNDVLDLCTGSGCIAIAIAEAFPEARVDASDISADALAVAKVNVLRHNMQEQVNLVQSDLFSNLPEKKYDVIVSNPPYVSQNEMVELPDEYRHEPELGLEAGNAGLDIVDKILVDAGNYLHDHGILIVEVGNSEIALSEKYRDVPFTWLEFDRGGGGVFLLTAKDVKDYFTDQRKTSVR